MDLWIAGGTADHQVVLRNVPLRMSCSRIYDVVAETTGIEADMLLLSTGVKILRKDYELQYYANPTSIQHGINLFLSLKCPGGGGGEDGGQQSGRYTIFYVHVVPLCMSIQLITMAL